jgi:predicted TIM-barrel fold metal-dependent hydrolase
MLIDSHAHFEPRMLDLAGIVRKMDEVGVQKIALIPAMNDPLPQTPKALLTAMRVLMRSAPGRVIAERVHRVTLTPEGDLRLGNKVFQLYSQPDNASVAMALRQYPERFLGWIFLNPRNNPKVLEELEEWRSTPGMIGVKLHPHWHDYRVEMLWPLLARAQELRLPILIHLGFGKRGDFRTICQKFPSLTVIAAHAGFPFYDELWRQALSLPNLYIDLSSPYIDERLARDAVKVLGPRRCLYGTDAPYGFHESDDSYDYREIKGWIERMPLRSEEQSMIFGGNFERLLVLSKP